MTEADPNIIPDGSLSGARIDARRDGRGNPYYWIAFERKRSHPAEGTDLWAIYEGMVSVTPLSLDLTHKESCDRLVAVLKD